MEILLFHVFVLCRWRLLVLISLSKWATFVKGMFTVASAVVKNLLWEEQFPNDAIGYYHVATKYLA